MDGPVVIVVDILGEWGDDASRPVILSAVEHWIRKIPKVKFLVTSRPNPMFPPFSVFRSLAVLPISIHSASRNHTSSTRISGVSLSMSYLSSQPRRDRPTGQQLRNWICCAPERPVSSYPPWRPPSSWATNIHHPMNDAPSSSDPQMTRSMKERRSGFTGGESRSPVYDRFPGDFQI